MKKRVSRMLTFLLAGVLAVSGGYIAWKNLDYHRGAKAYASAAQAAGLSKRPEPPKPGASAAPELPEGPSFTEQLAAIDLAALQEVNPDVLGWIAIPDTELSYPLLQCSNNVYYLNHLWNKQRNSSGAIYLETNCTPDFSGFNTIIYGHRMRDTSMFGTLPLYSSLEFFQQHPTIYLADSSGVHQYDIFAAYEVGVREMVYRLDIDQPEEIQELIQFCLSHSVIQTGVVPGVEDSILTLSTCTERGHSTRWVVQAVLREDGGEAN